MTAYAALFSKIDYSARVLNACCGQGNAAVQRRTAGARCERCSILPDLVVSVSINACCLVAEGLLCCQLL